MTEYNFVEVEVHPSGVVRVYGNEGLIFEVRGKYVRSHSFVDAQKPNPSGELPPKKPD